MASKMAGASCTMMSSQVRWVQPSMAPTVRGTAMLGPVGNWQWQSREFSSSTTSVVGGRATVYLMYERVYCTVKRHGEALRTSCSFREDRVYMTAGSWLVTL